MNVGAVSGAAVFNQRFFYVDNGTKKEVEIDPINGVFDAAGATAAVNFPESANSGAENTNTSTPTNTTTSVDNNTIIAANNTPPVTNPETTTPHENSLEHKLNEFDKKHNDKKEVKTKEPAPESTVKSASGLVFKIQLGAFNLDPGKAKFKALGNVTMDSESGMFKVLFGSYGSKEDALKKLETVKAKGFDGFIVRYQDGVRVK